MRRTFRACSAGVAIVLLATGLALASTDPQELLVVRAYFQGLPMLQGLAAWKAPWEVHPEKGYALLDATPEEILRLEAEGFRVEVDAKRSAALRRPRPGREAQPEAIPGFPCYRTVEETYATAAQIVSDHPGLAAWIDIGDTWEKVQNPNLGYDLMVLRLTNSAVPGPKPKMFVMTSIHAREYTPAELSTRFAEYLASNHGVDPDVTWLLDYNEVHLVLQANPDGRKKAETGLLWRKNTNGAYCGAASNSRGADLNRNYAFEWNCCGGSSGSACSETYHGASAGSEPETQAIQNYVLGLFPDQRGPNVGDPAPADANGIFLDIHSYSNLVLWPWGFSQSQTAPNGPALQTLGRKFAWYNGYTPEQSSELYVTDGSTDDYAYGQLGVAAYTFELGTEFFQDCSDFEGSILPDNLAALIYALKVARTPYQTPAGPDALSVAVSPKAAAAGDAVTLTASVNDTRFDNSNGAEPVQNVSSAEYYVDTPPWLTSPVPAAHPMSAADGSFNSPAEAVQATVDVTGLATGRHILFVRGRDAAGNWGAFTATFLYLVDPATSPKIQGIVREAGTDLPLAATLTATGGFQTATNPADGSYQMLVPSGTYTLTATEPDHAPKGVAGLTAQDLQTIQQDFALDRICAAYANDIEAGVAGWTAAAPWAITTEAAHTPARSWTDSPGGSYSSSRNVAITSPVLDLSGFGSTTLSFWQICDTEATYDFCRVEISANGGANWTQIAAYDGPHTVWEPIELSVPALDQQPAARLRFRFTSDTSIEKDGWHLDDVRLTGVSPVCTGAPPNPTGTPTSTPSRTSTPTPSLTRTPTRSMTPTSVPPSATATSVPPSATATSAPPTETPTIVPSGTSTPSGVPSPPATVTPSSTPTAPASASPTLPPPATVTASPTQRPPASATPGSTPEGPASVPALPGGGVMIVLALLAAGIRLAVRPMGASRSAPTRTAG